MAKLETSFFLFLIITFCSATNPTTTFDADNKYKLTIGNETDIYIQQIKNKTLHISLDTTLFKTDGPFKRCRTGLGELDVCLQWGLYTLNITVLDGNCQVIEQTDNTGESELSVCFEYGEDHWFGGPERWYQNWPTESVEIDNKPLLTGYDASQSVAEPFWVTSSGSSIYVFEETALFLDSNKRQNGRLCLIARNDEPYNKRNRTILRHEVCQWENAVVAQKNASARYFKKPTGRPEDVVFKEPIYSTWVRFGRDFNQEKLTALVEEIRNHSFPVGQIEIDDIWEPCYGAWDFDTNRFPNISGFTNYVHSLGGRVTAWIYPFVNVDCNPAYSEGLEKDYFIKGEDGDTTMQWWCGTGGAVDFTKEAAAKWFLQRLQSLVQKSGIDSYKFDAGETTYLPSFPQLSADPEQIPNIYVKKYLETASAFKGFMEVRTARGTQDLPVLVRMLDKDSRFTLDNGLQSVITTLFQMNIVGYPFVLPDMIGGNAYGNSISKELFIRWLQASTFMPALQFSILPWDYDAETIEIARQYLALHNSYSSLIIESADNAVANGTPINTPIWWVAPDDEDALKCRDEYLLAEKILVAPVVEEGAVSRDVYLPTGDWLDASGSRQIIKGPVWLRQYDAPLSVLPYFIRQ